MTAAPAEIPVPVFGPAETITVAGLAVGDWVVEVPTQQGVRGTTVKSGVRDLRADWGTWRRSAGYRRPKLAIESRVIMFCDPHVAAVNYPADFAVAVRRPLAGEAADL